jgi:CxxC motif-containing protein (DUF1111 family)
MTHWKMVAGIAAVLAAAAMATSQGTPHDPGPRTGPPAAGAVVSTSGITGGAYPTLNATEQAAFTNGIAQFVEEEGVPDQPPGTGNGGLGPGFNSTSCGSCHSQPAILGSSPGVSSPQVPQPNPQIAAATAMGATNVIPSFITAGGPVREARFVRNPDGTPDGGVHNLFNITGRTDAVGCNLAQPNFAAQLAANNVIFRIPTPLFGLGLVDNTLDATFKANLAANSDTKSAFGIAGRFNRVGGGDSGIQGHFNLSGNDGTISKFGWKAQNKSITLFAGEAYNVEMGVTNDVMPNERNGVAGCVFNAMPEDSHSVAANGISDLDAFVDAIRLSAPPVPAPATADTKNGQDKFNKVGCVLCHSDTLTSAQSIFTGMSNVTYHPFSDFALHHMGEKLADGVSQGLAGPDEFRTAPLWGVGQRLYFLHDGRTADLLEAIQQHSSRGSEANQVVRRFNALSPGDQQAVLDFLRSL